MLKIDFLEENNKPTIVKVFGRIDGILASDFQEKIQIFIKERGTTNLVLDFSETESITSAGLRSIIILSKMGIKVSFRGVHGIVKEVFQLAGFYSIFNIEN